MLQKPSILWLVPVLTFATYFLTSKINRKLSYQPATADGADAKQVACSNTMMDVTMPLMSVYIAFITPAAVGVYWIFKSIISTLSRFILSRAMPYPTFTEEDYKAAEKEFRKFYKKFAKSFYECDSDRVRKQMAQARIRAYENGLIFEKTDFMSWIKHIKNDVK